MRYFEEGKDPDEVVRIMEMLKDKWIHIEKY